MEQCQHTNMAVVGTARHAGCEHMTIVEHRLKCANCGFGGKGIFIEFTESGLTFAVDQECGDPIPVDDGDNTLVPVALASTVEQTLQRALAGLSQCCGAGWSQPFNTLDGRGTTTRSCLKCGKEKVTLHE